jgi:small subunit ribosomal protein S9
MPEKNKKNKDYIFAVGRRREAVARVRMYPGQKKTKAFDTELKKGDFFVNGKDAYEYFRIPFVKPLIEKIFKDTDTTGKFTFTAKVAGGGKSSQVDAVLMGIARALEIHDKDKFRPTLKREGYLSRDPRVRERRKVGTGGKARRKKQSPKR